MVAAVQQIEMVLVVTCGSCFARLAITYQPSMGHEPHLYGIECPSCGRITMRRLRGVLLRVATTPNPADIDQAEGPPVE